MEVNRPAVKGPTQGLLLDALLPTIDRSHRRHES